MDRSVEAARTLIAVAHERRAELVAKLERLVDTQQELTRFINLTRRELSALDTLLAQQQRALALADDEQRVLQEAESLARREPRAEQEPTEAVEQLLQYLTRHFSTSPSHGIGKTDPLLSYLLRPDQENLTRHISVTAGAGTGKTEALLSFWLRPEQVRPSIAAAARLALDALGRPAHLSEIADLMAVEAGRRPPFNSLMAALSRDDGFARTDIRGYWALAEWPEERRCVSKDVVKRMTLQEELAQERRRQHDLRLNLEQMRRALSQAERGEPPLKCFDPEDLKVQSDKLQDLLRASEARTSHLHTELDKAERILANLDQSLRPGTQRAERRRERTDGLGGHV